MKDRQIRNRGDDQWIREWRCRPASHLKMIYFDEAKKMTLGERQGVY